MSCWKRLKFRLWTELGYHRAALPLFRWYGRWRGRGLGRISSRAEIIIEGYPRSANSFVVAAFRAAQGRTVEMVHHLHSSATVCWAVRRCKPVVVLIRRPADAVASLAIRSPFMPVAQLLRDYIQFYTRVLPVRDSVLLVTFEDATDRLDEVVHRINTRFDTSFIIPDMSPEFKARCFATIEEVETRFWHSVDELHTSRPSADRAEEKARIRDTIESGTDQHLLRCADTLYDTMLNKVSGRQG